METQRLPPKYTSPKGMWVSKFILRSIMLIFSIALVGLAGSFMTLGFFSSLPFIIVAPGGFLSLGWNLAEGICIITRGGHRGIHPGANVGLDLIIWLGLIVMCVFLSVFGIGASLLSGYSSYSSILYARSHEPTSYTSYGAASSIASKGRALTGIGATLVIFHFATFVIACYETNVRNRMGRQQTIVMVQNAPAPMQTTLYGQQPGFAQPLYPQPTFTPLQSQPMTGQPMTGQPMTGQPMYYPPVTAPVFNQHHNTQHPQQLLHPPKAVEAYQGQPSTPSPPPPVYPNASPVSSLSELAAQNRN